MSVAVGPNGSISKWQQVRKPRDKISYASEHKNLKKKPKIFKTILGLVDIHLITTCQSLPGVKTRAKRSLHLAFPDSLIKCCMKKGNSCTLYIQNWKLHKYL